MAASTGLTQLSSDLIKRYTSGADADVTFVFTVGQIRAHKMILTTRVPYFEKMFSPGTKESRTNRVEMPKGIDKMSFDVFLRYIYGGLLPKVFDVEHQLKLAKMYEVPALITDCLPMLKEDLSKVSKFDVLIEEVSRMMTTYKIEAAKPTMEKALIKRLDDLELDPTIIPNYCIYCDGRYRRLENYPGRCSLCYCCNGCGYQLENATAKCTCQTTEEWGASYINQLVKLLTLAHSEKCAALKEKLLRRFVRIDEEFLFEPQMADAFKQLEEHPELLVVLRRRINGC